MSFEREIIRELRNWRYDFMRKPLIIRGARQVGKTTTVKSFGKEFQHSIFLNLERSNHLEFFTEFQDIEDILEAILIRYNIQVIALNDTLLFIDEIQESPRAIQMLRYFYEDYPALKVIAAGSLLEFALKDVKSFPVGRVEYMYMYPLNFQEFLLATGQQAAYEQLRSDNISKTAIKVLMKFFHQYILIGGMPEAIKRYVADNSVLSLPRVYQSIWKTYRDDTMKYASGSAERKVIRHIMSTAHLYLDKRITYQNFGNSNYRSREVGEALKNLHDAMVIQLIYPTTDLEVPVRPDLKKSPRLQFLDTGIINHYMDMRIQLMAIDDLSYAYKGALLPHIITQEIMSLNKWGDQRINFWVRQKSQSSAEVDLVIPEGDLLIPVEIKSGKVGKLRSLHQFIDRCNHHYAVRVYGGEMNVEHHKTPAGKDYTLFNLPYCLGTQIYRLISDFVANN